MENKIVKVGVTFKGHPAYEYRGFHIQKDQHYSGRGFSYSWSLRGPGYRSEYHETRGTCIKKIDAFLDRN